MWVVCPDSLDADDLRLRFGRRIAEGVLWLGHSIYTGLAEDASCRDSGRVLLKAEYLRNIVGRHHLKGVRDAAQKIGYVDYERSYRVGEHSMPYWILPPYDTATLVWRESPIPH